jgi:hypothetical protein
VGKASPLNGGWDLELHAVLKARKASILRFQVWGTIGPRCDLLVHVLQNAEELKAAAAEPLDADRLSIRRRTSGIRSGGSAERASDFAAALQEAAVAVAAAVTGPLAPQQFLPKG